jgi:hypothetical protein
MKKISLFLACFFLFSFYTTKAQIYINAYTTYNNQNYTDTVRICEGDSLIVYSNSYFINSNFNNGILDTVWDSNVSIMYSNPCPPTDLPSSGISCWLGSNSYPRMLVSKPLNIIGSNCIVSWDMKYGANQNSTNCESPDLPTEGIHLQWSIDSGATWTQFPGVDIAPTGTFGTPGYQNGSGGYWTPVPGNVATGSFYKWNHYQSPIPAAAITPYTKIRFYQDIASGNTFDHWGLDNIIIESASGSYTIDWHLNGNFLCYGANTYKHSPLLGTHKYIVSAYNLFTGNSVSDTLIVIVKPKPEKPIITVTNIVLVSNYQFGNQWYYNNFILNGAISHFLKPNVNGEYYVVVKDSVTGCKSEPSLPVAVNNVGINELKSNFRITPNPANESFYIETYKKINSLQIYDLMGKKLKTFSEIPSSIPINISDLDDGSYFLHLSIANEVYISKLIKSKK